MTVMSFNDGWSCQVPAGPFAAMSGAAIAPTAIRLPHDALRDADRNPIAPAGGAAAYYPNAAYTYKKTFDVPLQWEGMLVTLEVQGAFRRAQVFLNDELAGNRADGYARFFLNLTPYLRYGQVNELRVEVRSGQDSRWYAGAGLHRPVLLHVNRPVHIVPDGISVSTVRLEEDQAVVDVVTTIANAGLSTRTVALASDILAPDGRMLDSDSTPVTLAPGEQAAVRQRHHVPNPALWSPDHPHLHNVVVRLNDDQASMHQVPLGIRVVTVDPRKGLRVNGEPILLRGACIHSDNGPLGAAGIARADERRVEKLKEAGFNALRAAHNPLSPALLDACDRLGMLVMDEAFDVWTRFKTYNDYATEFPQWWSADLESMIAKDRNHPSVIMYSLGNEIIEVGTSHGSRWARRMADHVRALDPTRLVTNGINPFLAVIDEVPAMIEAAGGGLNQAMSMEGAFSTIGASEPVTRRTAESSAVLDVLGLNYSESRYELDQQLFPHRVIVGSETFPVRIGELWPMVQRHPNVIGDFTWTGWDYLGEVGIGATAYAEDPDSNSELEREFPFLTAWCGDIDITGWRRPVSYYREIVFGLRVEPYIAVRRPQHNGHTITMQSPWAWSDSIASWTWPGYEGVLITVEVYAAADEIALLIDGEEVTRETVGRRRPLLAELTTPYRPGVLTAVALRDGVEQGRATLTTAGQPLLSATTDRTNLTYDDDDLAFISIELRDIDCQLVTCDDRVVTVTIEGPASLAGMCSANPRTNERFDAPSWTTFDGRALAVLRPEGLGSIRVTVTSPALEPCTILLQAHPEKFAASSRMTK